MEADVQGHSSLQGQSIRRKVRGSAISGKEEDPTYDPPRGLAFFFWDSEDYPVIPRITLAFFISVEL